MAAFIRENIFSSLISSLNFSIYLQWVTVRISFVNTECIIVLCHRSSSCRNDSCEDFILNLEVLCQNQTPPIILDDFNFFDISWSQSSRGLGNGCHGKQSSLLYCFIQSRNSSETVSHATRGHNTLDLVLTNSPALITSPSVQAPFSTSDHPMVTFSLGGNRIEAARTENRFR